MTWLPEQAGGATAMDRVFGLRPELFAAARTWYAHVWDPPVCDPVLLELVRLRVAQLHGCRAELSMRFDVAIAAGLDPAKADAVASWPTDPRFSVSERAVLGFAELFVIDPHAITDAAAIEVAEHLGDAATVGLANALAVYDGFMRMRILLGADEPVAAEPVVVPAPSTGAGSWP